MAPRELTSARLRLIPATTEIINADIAGPVPLAAAIGATVSAEWPPEHYDEAALRWTLAQLEDRAQWGWSSFYLVAGGVLIGLCGFKGPPDASGTIEIGYELVPSARGIGYASEAVNRLVDHALTVPAVLRVIAETRPELVPSIRLLERCGFRLTGEGSERGVIRYELTRADAEAGHRTIPAHLRTLFRLQGHMAWANRQALTAIRNAGTGVDKALELLNHILGAEHVWLSRMQGVPATVAVWPHLSVDAAAAQAAQNELGFRALLFRLSVADLRRTVSYRNSAGEEFASSFEDILLHLFLHGSYHRGQIAQRQALDGQAPSPTDYIAFARGASAAVRVPGVAL